MTSTALLLDSFDTPPELDTAISAASVRAVASGELPDLFRIHIPARVVAFGRQDTHTPGFNRAVAACKAVGFTPVIGHLAGGRAAVFHEGTLAFSWQTRTDQPKLGITERFEFITSVLVAGLESLGLGAAVGEVPGEYCPGRYSIHISQKKIAGVGQRLVSGAASWAACWRSATRHQSTGCLHLCMRRWNSPGIRTSPGRSAISQTSASAPLSRRHRPTRRADQPRKDILTVRPDQKSCWSSTEP